MNRRHVRQGVVLAVLVALIGVGVSGVAASAAQDAGDQVYRNVPSDRLEGILRGMNIVFTKVPGKMEGVNFYDFDRGGFKIRLHNYNGKDLWIDALFNDRTTLEKINGWNRRAKFSRAVLISSGGKETISLESQMDCLGGVTDNIIRQFINRFDGEIRDFVKYHSN